MTFLEAIDNYNSVYNKFQAKKLPLSEVCDAVTILKEAVLPFAFFQIIHGRVSSNGYGNSLVMVYTHKAELAVAYAEQSATPNTASYLRLAEVREIDSFHVQQNDYRETKTRLSYRKMLVTV